MLPVEASGVIRTTIIVQGAATIGCDVLSIAVLWALFWPFRKLSTRLRVFIDKVVLLSILRATVTWLMARPYLRKLLNNQDAPQDGQDHSDDPQAPVDIENSIIVAFRAAPSQTGFQLEEVNRELIHGAWRPSQPARQFSDLEFRLPPGLTSEEKFSPSPSWSAITVQTVAQTQSCEG
ncbi:hypothetical protein EST38_g11520 [Candolleomyces aberdarensis]|uniref:Uncharacterized protein n=1 Tax=Candolleomyces aberdarensis TaxID=2316362 RepID=A0A4Q2D7D1_9AGAR|nr:hypothetical protein EST38_g11520 [Candolleomyces aberdarensis]